MDNMLFSEKTWKGSMINSLPISLLKDRLQNIKRI